MPSLGIIWNASGIVRKRMMERRVQMDSWWRHGGRKNNAPKLRGTISIIISVIHFVLFWKHDKGDELWVFRTVWKILRHKSKHSWMEGKRVTVSYICITDTFCFYNWLWVTIWDVQLWWICVNLVKWSSTLDIILQEMLKYKNVTGGKSCSQIVLYSFFQVVLNQAGYRLLNLLHNYRAKKTCMGIYRCKAWPLVHFTHHWGHCDPKIGNSEAQWGE